MSKSRVVLSRCADYDLDRVRAKVAEILQPLGGMAAFVQSGQSVLIKPNMLSARAPEDGVTTHPAVLRAVIEQVQAAGGIPRVGDSPSGAIKGVARCWEATGFLEVCRQTGVELVHFEKAGSIGRTIGDLTYHLATPVVEADVVINLPKMKTHGFTLYTGAIKNLYGTLPGFQKANFHKLYPHPRSFSRLLVDIYGLIRPALHLVDGIIGMEGDGPATGVVRHNGLLAASADGVALDAVLCHLMGFRPGEVEMVALAGAQGLGRADLSAIQIIGEALEGLRFTDYALPSNRLMSLIPERLMRWGGKLIYVRPQVDRSRCVSCGVCAQGCPVDAIQMADGYPVFDYKKCINCLCCNESCSEGAVRQRLSWLARRFG